MGYVEETGSAQHLRDSRIAPIYEGTNGIQALDLVGRKLPYEGGAFVTSYLADLATVLDEIPDSLAPIREQLAKGFATLEEVTGWILARRERPNDVFAGATPYLRVFATVVGGALLAKGAVAAQAALDAGSDEAAYLAAKVVTARFYATQLLPQVHGLADAVTAGADDLYAVDADQLASR
jgi:3-(methylthio)propanoyl-CoA dehydrogenase